MNAKGFPFLPLGATQTPLQTANIRGAIQSKSVRQISSFFHWEQKDVLEFSSARLNCGFSSSKSCFLWSESPRAACECSRLNKGPLLTFTGSDNSAEPAALLIEDYSRLSSQTNLYWLFQPLIWLRVVKSYLNQLCTRSSLHDVMEGASHFPLKFAGITRNIALL